MSDYIVIAFVGIIISVLGVINMSGNISTIHWYHRKRVSEENVKPFGRLVGGGSLIIGVAIIAFSAMSYAFEKLQIKFIMNIGIGILIFGYRDLTTTLAKGHDLVANLQVQIISHEAGSHQNLGIGLRFVIAKIIQSRLVFVRRVPIREAIRYHQLHGDILPCGVVACTIFKQSVIEH